MDIERRVNPEDPTGAGIELTEGLGVEGNVENIGSLFFPSTEAHPSLQGVEVTALIRVFGLGSHLYTFCDLRFTHEFPWQKSSDPYTVKDVVVIPMTYEDFKKGLEGMGLMERRTFYKVAEKVLRRRPRALTFPKFSFIQHLSNINVGGGEYVILCGEQVEGGERVTLIDLRKGALRLPKRE